MRKRNNFTRAVLVEMAHRAGGRCEGCGAVGVPLQGHHKDMDAMEVAKRKLTAEDGKMLCNSCHRPITKRQLAELAIAKARESSHLGIKKGGRPVQKINGNPDALKSKKRPKHEGRPPVDGLPQIARRFGLK